MSAEPPDSTSNLDRGFKKTMGQQSKWTLLSIPLGASASVWPICFAIPYLAAGAEPEGAGLVAAFVSMILFALAGPLAGVVLSKMMRTEKLSLGAFLGLFLLVTSPMLCFQAIVYYFSALTPFLRIVVTDQTLYTSMVRAAVLGVCVYATFSLVFYLVAKWGTLPATATAAVLFSFSLAVTMTQVIHPFV